MQRITIRIPEKLLNAIENRAALEQRSVSYVAREVLSLSFCVPQTPKLSVKKNPKLKGI